MGFTDEELKLICRALAFYSEHPEYLPNNRLDDDAKAAALAIKIYRERFRI